MQSSRYYTLLLIIWSITLSAQSVNFNLDLERGGGATSLPTGWGVWGEHTVSSDSAEVHGGRQAIRISGKDADAFGSCYLYLEPGYTGKEISVEGWIKHEKVDEGYVGLLLRLDGAEGNLGFYNMEDENVNGTGDWQQYRITLPYPERAVRRIYLGGLLSGSGTAWFDDFTVKIDGKDLSTLKRQEPQLFPAQLDSSFANGSKFNLQHATARQLQRLELLARVWGYVKYHHAAVAAGDHNMDAELFRLLGKLEEPNFNQVLISWIDGLLAGTNITESLEEEADTEYVLINEHEWLDDDTMHPVLADRLRQLPRPTAGSPHYYLSFEPNVGNPVFQNEMAWENLGFDDTGIRLLTLFRYWNMIEYFFPYKTLTDTDWSEILSTYLPPLLEAESALAVQQIIFRLIGEVNDTHAGMWGKPREMQDFLPLLRVSAHPKYVEGKMVIARLGDWNDCMQLGDVVLAVNGRSTEELIEHYRPYAPASNEATVYRDIGRLLLGTDSARVVVTVERDGEVLELDCAAVGPKWGNWFGDERREGFELLEDGIGYIYAAGLNKGEVDRIMPEQLGLDGLIVDLRCYPSNFIVFSLGKYLVPRATPFVKFTRGSLVQPGNFSFTDPISVGDVKTATFGGKIVILVNEWTQSQAEYTAMALRRAPDAIVLGSTTAGADGNVSSIPLPGGVRTAISGIGVFYPDGSPTQRVGIRPDVELEPSFEGIRAGRDEQLEAALHYLRKE